MFIYFFHVSSTRTSLSSGAVLRCVCTVLGNDGVTSVTCVKRYISNGRLIRFIISIAYSLLLLYRRSIGGSGGNVMDTVVQHEPDPNLLVYVL